MRTLRILGVAAVAAGIVLSGTGFASAAAPEPIADPPVSGSAVLVKGLEALGSGSATAPKIVADPPISGSAVLLKGLEALATGSSAAPKPTS